VIGHRIPWQLPVSTAPQLLQRVRGFRAAPSGTAVAAEPAMDDTLARIWQEIAARPDGPLAMRFYLQPLMSSALAIRDGVADARTGRPYYFWTMFTDRSQRAALVRDGWHAEWKLFTIALVLDLAYQIIVLKGLRPFEGLLVAVVLAFVPYLLLRGLVNRLVRRTAGDLPPPPPDLAVR
jgi:hypothetical protein